MLLISMRNCVTRNTGKHREMKKNPTSKLLINFFRYGFKIFYPICCSRKRSADTSTMYFLGTYFFLPLELWARFAISTMQLILLAFHVHLVSSVSNFPDIPLYLSVRINVTNKQSYLPYTFHIEHGWFFLTIFFLNQNILKMKKKMFKGHSWPLKCVKCDCKWNWLWVQSPLKETKDLF